MKRTRITLNIQDFPAELHPFFSGAEVYDSSSNSCTSVLYLHPGYFLKIDGRGELEREALLTARFHGMGLGPEVVRYLPADRDYLLTRGIPGQDCLSYLDNPEQLCQVLAYTLRELHKRPSTGLPTSTRLERYLTSAENRDEGFWDESVLMPRFMIRSKDEAWDIMQANKHRLSRGVCIQISVQPLKLVLFYTFFLREELQYINWISHSASRTVLSCIEMIDRCPSPCGRHYLPLFSQLFSRK